jgi:hypothetical protein
MRVGWIAAAAAASMAAAGAGWLRSASDAPAATPGASRLPARKPPPSVDHPPGFWVKAPATAAATPERDPAHRELIARLEAIGYLAGVEPASNRPTGVVRRTAAAHAGPRLLVSGHAPEARLIDADGRELHRWHFPADRAFRDIPPERAHAVANFRRAHVYPNGNLLAIFEGVGLFLIDRHSELLWARQNGAHHDVAVLADGRIFALERTAHVVPAIDPERPVLEDFVVELGPDGSERRRVSLLAALLGSEHRALAGTAHPRLPAENRRSFDDGDLQHTNSLQVIARSHPTLAWLRAGNVLVSSRHLSALMVVDLDEERVVWLHRGDFLVQHEARLLDGGARWSVLLFDNHTRERGSRALELSLDGEPVWQYPPEGAGPVERFYSGCCGTTARLPGGNTLIAITTAGRAIEVTPAGEIAWEFQSPHRAGETGELVAALFDVVALPADFPLDWIARAPAVQEADPGPAPQAPEGRAQRAEGERSSSS